MHKILIKLGKTLSRQQVRDMINELNKYSRFFIQGFKNDVGRNKM